MSRETTRVENDSDKISDPNEVFIQYNTHARWFEEAFEAYFCKLLFYSWVLVLGSPRPILCPVKVLWTAPKEKEQLQSGSRSCTLPDCVLHL